MRVGRFVAASDLGHKKNLAVSNTYGDAQREVGQRLLAVEYLFSVSSQERLKSVAKFARG